MKPSACARGSCSLNNAEIKKTANISVSFHDKICKNLQQWENVVSINFWLFNYYTFRSTSKYCLIFWFYNFLPSPVMLRAAERFMLGYPALSSWIVFRSFPLSPIYILTRCFQFNYKQMYPSKSETISRYKPHKNGEFKHISFQFVRRESGFLFFSPEAAIPPVNMFLNLQFKKPINTVYTLGDMHRHLADACVEENKRCPLCGHLPCGRVSCPRRCPNCAFSLSRLKRRLAFRRQLYSQEKDAGLELFTLFLPERFSHFSVGAARRASLPPGDDRRQKPAFKGRTNLSVRQSRHQQHGGIHCSLVSRSEAGNTCFGSLFR